MFGEINLQVDNRQMIEVSVTVRYGGRRFVSIYYRDDCGHNLTKRIQ